MRIGLALLLSLMTLTGCGSSPEDISACRNKFTAHYGVLTENGNPARKDFTPKMSDRWNELHKQFGRLAKSATAEDCERRLQAMEAEVTNLKAVLHKIDDYDVALMTRRAEADLDRRAKKHGASYATDYVLITLLRTMRERGADAAKALAPLVASADTAKPGPERAAAMVALYNAAASNAAFTDFNEAKESIENYDFDDE